jgi:energy-coupling factor transport system ATP-binding protein
MSIELKNASFSYPNGYLANEDLNLKIDDGERLAIIGKNGAGKTTAVKLMNGLNRPETGEVLINGRNIKKNTCAEVAKYVGYVFQNPDEQIFNSNVKAEIEYMPRYFKLPESEIKERCEKAIEISGLKEYLKMNPLDIPYPIRKFVAIAAVIATKPSHIILDEPTAGQDKQGIETLETLIKELKREKVSVITITHDMGFAARNFPRIVVMAHKNIIADNNARTIFWDESILKDAGIKKPQIAQIAQCLGITETVLFSNELVAKLD